MQSAQVLGSKELVAYELASGEVVYVRAAVIPGEQAIGPSAAEPLQRVLGSVRSLLGEIIESVGESVASRVDHLTISVGLEVGAKGRLVICEGSSAAHLNVEITVSPASRA